MQIDASISVVATSVVIYDRTKFHNNDHKTNSTKAYKILANLNYCLMTSRCLSKYMRTNTPTPPFMRVTLLCGNAYSETVLDKPV